MNINNGTKIFKSIFLNLSVKTKLIVLLCICWIVPFVMITVGTIIYYNSFIVERTFTDIETSVSFAAQFTAEKLQNVIDKSKTYESEFETYVRQFDSSMIRLNAAQNKKQLRVDSERFLKSKFSGKQEYDFAMLVLDMQVYDADPLVSIVSNKANFYVNNFEKKHQMPILQKLSRSDDSKAQFFSDGYDIYYCRNFYKSSIFPIKQKYAYLIVKINSDYIFSDFRSQSFENNLFFSLDSSVGHLPSTEQGVFDLLQLEEYAAEPQGFSIIERVMPGDKSERLFIADVCKMNDFNFGYFVTVSNSILLRQIVDLGITCILIFLSITPLMILLTTSIYTNVTRPIMTLVKATSELKSGNLGVTVPAPFTNEFEYLFENFNSMSLEIKHLIDCVYREELALKEAKILSLQSQMNPHFLNNTLEIINWKARLSDNDDISNMIEALGSLLNASMNRDSARFVTLKEELRFVDSYLYIIKERFGKRVEINKEIDEDSLEYMVPKLIIQPLIENAIIHGIEPVRRGIIWVVTKKTPTGISIEIKNNGAELTSEKLTELTENLESGKKPKNNTRLGLSNVNERMRLIYGDDFGLQISKSENGHTIMGIFVPNR